MAYSIGINTGMPWIDLRARDGSVRARSLVDADRYDELAAFAWHLASGGYARRYLRAAERAPDDPPKIGQMMHRQVLGLAPGDGAYADHINRDRLDNRRENLRVVTALQNGWNQTQPGRGQSGVRGVHWWPQRGGWVARVRVNGRLITRGPFAEIAQAAVVAEELRATHHRLP